MHVFTHYYWRQGNTDQLKKNWSLVAQDGKESACHLEDLGSILGSCRSSGEGMATHSNILCLENPRNRGACLTTVHRVAKVRLDWSNLACMYAVIRVERGIEPPERFKLILKNLHIWRRMDMQKKEMYAAILRGVPSTNGHHLYYFYSLL